MVKNVVNPARSSVVNLALRISLGCESQSTFLCYLDLVMAYMTRAIEVKVLSNKGARHQVVKRSLVSLDEAHLVCRMRSEEAKHDGE